MTREQNIISALNLYEKRFRKAIEKGDEGAKLRNESILEGMNEMLSMLGYQPVIEEEVFIDEGYWIYKYGAIEDKRG